MATLQFTLTPGNNYVLIIPRTKAKIQINCPIDAPPFAIVTQGRGLRAEMHQFKFAPQIEVVEDSEEEQA